MKKLTLFGLALLAIALLTGCADVTNVEACIPAGEHTYGFWGGVWHGAICQFSFIGSLFNDDIAVYARNNNGAWYDFGFVGGLGIMIRIVALAIKGARVK
jgi:hypothetical protein